MKRFINIALLSVVLLGSISECSSGSTLIDMNVSGTLVETSSRADQAAIFQAEATFSGTLRIDLGTPVSKHLPGFGNHTLTRYSDAVVSSNFTINGVAFEYMAGANQEVQFLDFTGEVPSAGDSEKLGDTMRLFSYITDNDTGIDAAFNLQFFDLVSSSDLGYVGPYTDTTLTLDKFDFSGFSEEIHHFAVFSNDGAGAPNFTLDSISVVLVPEPSTTMLTIIGMIAFGVRRSLIDRIP